jgi:UDP-N-acetyl-D-galactosamine dehydrogenase
MSSYKIAIIGLGYVGLPLGVAFGTKINTIGYDINQERVEQLQKGIDSTLEIGASEISKANKLSFSSSIDDISKCNVYIITVPTPIDSHNQPILTPLMDASEAVGKILSPGDIVIYESTVYPGATEEICVPILEKNSSLKHISSDEINGNDLLMSQHFFTGYSPERINPGDKLHPLSQIVKIVSGSTPEIAEEVKKLYDLIITAGTYKAENIKVAEAAKIIENTQRDLNIALVNELAIIFNMLDIDTEAVLKAAQTKWNFASYTPGLVGGHCIGVDPYYLTFKANEIGYFPELILAGRNINNHMGEYIFKEITKLMAKNNISSLNAKILILGFTFKENCTDFRNTRVIDLVNGFKEMNCNVSVFDPWADKDDILKEYSIELLENLQQNFFDVIILAVPHDKFKKMGISNIRKFGKKKHIIYDIKHLFKFEDVDGRL